MRSKPSCKEIKRLSLSFILFITCLFLYHPFYHPVSSWAQEVKVFENLGPFGGQIYDIAIDPSDPNRMLAGSYEGDGLFLTRDGGNNWQAVETGNEPEGEATFKNHAVYAVKIAPSDPNIIWVAHNYWVEKGTDGGQTWTHILNGTMQRGCQNCGGTGDNFRLCRSVAIDPANHNIVYVGAGGPGGTYLSGAMYRTDDGGRTWTKLNKGVDFDYQVIDIDIDPQNSEVIWAVTSSEGYGGWAGTLYRSSDSGDSWEGIFSFNSGFLSIAIKPNDPNTIYTGSGYGIIRHYLEGGQWGYEWPIISDSGLVQDIAFDPRNPEIVYATWKNPWEGDHIPKIAKSMDGGSNWEIYKFKVDYEFQTLAVHPADSDIIFGGDMYLGVYKGVYKSEDQDLTWNPVNNGINAVVVYDVAIDPWDSTHLLAGTISGLFEKKGAGIWSRLLEYTVRSVKFHPSDSQTFYAGLMYQFAKTVDGGDTWDFFETGTKVNDIAIDPSNPETIFLAVRRKGEEAGQILRSLDGGATFEDVLDGVNRSDKADKGYDFNVVRLDPSNPQHLFAGGGNLYTPRVPGDLWESEDGGDNWTRTGLRDVIVNALLIDPQDPNIIYAGCGYSSGTDIPLYKSINGGTSWSGSHEGIPGISLKIWAVWVSHDGYAFVGGGRGGILHYSGSVWTEMDSGITEDIEDIWGASATDVFAISNEVILHYNGKAWTTMNSGITEHLYEIWGGSGTDVFAVGDSGTILHYDGNAWALMESRTTRILEGVWGNSGNDVFVVGEDGIVLHYDGSLWTGMDLGTYEDLVDVGGSSGGNVFVVGWAGGIYHYDRVAWSVMRERGFALCNSITDLEFHPKDSGILYAGTLGAGVYLSPNQARRWLNLGKPAFSVYAIATSSLYAATQGGLWQLTGTGVIAGRVMDDISQLCIDKAKVFNDLGAITLCVDGEYMMVSPAGVCSVTSIADDYAIKTADEVNVYGGDVAIVDFSLERGVPDPSVFPQEDIDRTSGRISYCFIATAASASLLWE